jgi:hypothetical protein
MILMGPIRRPLGPVAQVIVIHTLAPIAFRMPWLKALHKCDARP